MKEIDRRLAGLEAAVAVLNAEQVAAELVTVGRNLVRVLREFDEVCSTALADPGGKPTGPDRRADDRTPGWQPPQSPGTGYPEGLPGQVSEERPPPYGPLNKPAGAEEEASAGEQEPRAREMTYPEYWEMIATALGELADQLEQLSVEAVQRALIWHQAGRAPLPYRGGPVDGPGQVDPGQPRFARGRTPFPEGDPAGAGG